MGSPAESVEEEHGFGPVFSQLREGDIVFKPSAPKRVGRYLFGESLGKGSFAKVKEAVDLTTRQRVAIKILKKILLRKTPHGLACVQQEIELWERLDHVHIVRMHRHYESPANDKIYIVMEYMDGGTLQDLVERSPHMRLPLSQARNLFQCLHAGLQYIHSQGIVHKDIKPANCMLTSTGLLKIADFGVAELVVEGDGDNDTSRRVRSGPGSPAFQPPEIASGVAKQPTFLGDVWACGVTLYFMITGKFPFEGTTVYNLFENIVKCKWELPAWVDDETTDLLEHILVADCEQRYSLDQIKAHSWMNKHKEKIKSSHEDKETEESDSSGSTITKSRQKSGENSTRAETQNEEFPLEFEHVQIPKSPSLFEEDTDGLVVLNQLENEARNSYEADSRCSGDRTHQADSIRKPHYRKVGLKSSESNKSRGCGSCVLS